MKVTQEQLPASQIGLDIEIPAEKSKSIYERVVREIAKNTDIPGFRRGKIPRPVLLQRLGRERVKAAVLEELIQNSLQEAIEKESIKTLGNYQLRSDFEELISKYNPGEVFIFQAAVDVPPEVNLAQYQDLSVKAEEIVYNPEEVDKLLEDRRDRLATLIPIEDRPAQMGDVTIVDFEGRKPTENEDEEGELIEDTKAEESTVELSEGKFIPGFVEGIVGMNLEETKKLHLTFPEDYPQKDLAGEPVVFTITLKDLKEKELPDLDDDFAQEVSEFETMAELRESLEKQYQEKASNETKANIHKAIIAELLQHNEVELPETLIEEEIQNLLVQTASQLQNAGLDIKEFFTREMVDNMKKTARPEAVSNIQTNLIIAKIAEQESLNISEEEIAEKITQITENSQEQDFNMEKLHKYVSQDLLQDKTLEWLREKNQVELVPQGSLSQVEESVEEEEESSEEDNSQEN